MERVWDFGSGQIGDMGSHTMDLAWNALDAELPTSAQAKGDPFNPEVTPVRLQEDFEIPANDWRRAIRVSWYRAGPCPESPVGYVDLNKIDHGALFEGTKGALVSGFDTRPHPRQQPRQPDLLQIAPKGEAHPAPGQLPEAVDQRLQGQPDDLL